MKTLFSILFLLISDTAFAATPTKIGFTAYSTAGSASVQCTIFGAPNTLPRDANGTTIQGFRPTSTFQRTFVLGRALQKNYSTNYVSAVTWQCIQAGTAGTAATNVKITLDDLSTHFLFLPTGTWYIGQ
jgi:hypothetical protein